MMAAGTIQSRGFSLIYTTIAMTAMLGMISLAVDLGRVQLAKTQLRQAADAAARYAVTGLSDGTYLTKAQTSATENRVDGTAVTLLAADVVPGRWYSGAFTANATPYNAVSVTANRIATRGTAIPLLWAGLIGRGQCNVSAIGVSSISQSGGNGFVGLNSASISTNGSIDSFNSNYGLYGSSNGKNGDVATNGTLTLAGGVQVNGDAFYRSGYNTAGGAAVVSPGAAYYNSTPLSYPDPVLPGTYINYGAFSASSGTYYVSAGNYYFSSLTLSGSVTMVATGQVNLYVGGPVSITGAMNNSSGLPGNMRILTTVATTVVLNTSADFYADVYCPNSTVTVSGANGYYGRIIGKTLSVSGSPSFHYDESLNTLQNSISTVK